MTAGNAALTSQLTAPPVPDLEVIVPALNEQGRIESTLGALADHLSTLDLDSKVRVIDNGSTDRTPDIVDRVNSTHEVDITVEGCSRPGKGSAVARGMLTSQARWVGFCDADLATPAGAIGEAVDCLEEGWPVVIGSRHVEGARLVIDQPLGRRLGGTGFRMLTKSLAGDLDLADTQCGFKFFDGQAAREIFSRTGSTGFAFDVEVLTQAKELGYAVKELPVEWTDRDGSTFRPVKHGVEVTRDLLRLRRDRRGRVSARR